MVGPTLQGKRIVVGGGTGDVGVAVVAELLDAGAEVVVPVRDRRRAAGLPQSPRLEVVDGFPADDAGVASLTAALNAGGGIDGAVASLGPWQQAGRLEQVTLADWQAAIDASLTSHFLFARAALPALLPDGSYIFVNGAAALNPVPGAGPISMMARAQTMLADVIVAEHPVLHVHTVMVKSIIATRRRPDPDPRWVTATDVGRTCCWLFGDLGRLTRGSTVSLSMRAQANQPAD